MDVERDVVDELFGSWWVEGGDAGFEPSATIKQRRLRGTAVVGPDPPTIGGGEWSPASPTIASSAAIRFSVAGWVENRLSPRPPRPGTM